MLKANSRQFFNKQMKGRRARIRNQKRSKHYRSRLDRFLDNHAYYVEQEKQKKLKQEVTPYLPVKKRILTPSEELAREKVYNWVVAVLITLALFAIGIA